MSSPSSARERGALDREHRVARGHVGDRDVRVLRKCRRIQVSTWRCTVSEHTTRNSCSDFRRVMVRSASIPPAVRPLRVDDAADGYVDVVAAQPIEGHERVPSLHDELRHEGHVHQDHVLPAGPVLFRRPYRRPVLPPPAVGSVTSAFSPCRRVPVGDLPTRRLHEAGAGLGQAIVEDVALHVAGRLERVVREVDLVHLADDLDGAIPAVVAVRLVGTGSGRCSARPRRDRAGRRRSSWRRDDRSPRR